MSSGPPSSSTNALHGKHVEHPAIDTNQLFVKYYRDVNQLCDRRDCPDSSCSWKSFSDVMETPLPSSFWINDCDPLAQKFIQELKSVGGSFIQPIPWYPIKDCGWRVTATKEEFRKADACQPLRHLMIRLTALGVISRQEEVSMIPPLLLDIKKDDRCLDMCAAPGSKTAQMLVSFGRDLISRHESSSASATSNRDNDEMVPYDYSSATKGFVVANELDEKRSNMLVHQCKRIQHLFPFAIFTNHDARQMPSLEAERSGDDAHDASGDGDEYFDKILCDVMCSGDGILRKAPRTVLKMWKPFEAAQALHASQVHVALRGAHLLKVGGRLVYSTCSMNPVENEAVVCQIINQTRGALRLMDARTQLLPQLRCDPGMKSWKVMMNDGRVIDKYSDEIKQELNSTSASHVAHAFSPSLFPPANVDDIPLERCIRLLPHHCNGGGFFVSVFEKVRHVPHHHGTTTSPSSGSVASDAVVAVDAAPTTKEERKINEALTTLPHLPFLQMPENIQHELLEEYGMTVEDFPLVRNLVYRSPTEHQLQQRRERQQLQQQQQQEQPPQHCGNDDGKLKNLEERPIEMSINGAVTVVASSVHEVLIKKRNPKLRICAAGLRAFVPGLGLGKWKIANEAARIVAGSLIKANSPRLIVLPPASKDILFKSILYPMLFSESPLKDIPLESIGVTVPTKGDDDKSNNNQDGAATSSAAVSVLDDLDPEQQRIAYQLQQLPVGCVLLQVLIEGSSRSTSGSASTSLFIPCLKARSRLQLLTDLEDTEGLKCRLGFNPSQSPTNKGKVLNGNVVGSAQK